VADLDTIWPADALADWLTCPACYRFRWLDKAVPLKGWYSTVSSVIEAAVRWSLSHPECPFDKLLLMAEQKIDIELATPPHGNRPVWMDTPIREVRKALTSWHQHADVRGEIVRANYPVQQLIEGDEGQALIGGTADWEEVDGVAWFVASPVLFGAGELVRTPRWALRAMAAGVPNASVDVWGAVHGVYARRKLPWKRELRWWTRMSFVAIKRIKAGDFDLYVQGNVWTCQVCEYRHLCRMKGRESRGGHAKAPRMPQDATSRAKGTSGGG
jgi:hypothetical protein